MPFQFRKEAIEEDLNSTFPSQGQGNPPLYYSLSETVVPTYSINNVAEGSSLSLELQTALDFATSVTNRTTNGTSAVANTPGFYLIYVNYTLALRGAQGIAYTLDISDGVTTKNLWEVGLGNSSANEDDAAGSERLVVYLRSGDTLEITSVSGGANGFVSVTSRQIATINGTLVNPLGFSAA